MVVGQVGTTQQRFQKRFWNLCGT
eukprot:COSAG06_NODE_208_length_20182_cov_31.214759_28_plen_23_part_01